MTPSGFRHQGKVAIPSKLVRRLAAVSSGGNDSCSRVSEKDVIITTSLLEKTSNPHKDRLGSTIVEDDVGFIFLNNNEDATFVHGNVRTPVKSGSLVAFKGDILHNTIVPRGKVELLGPFALESLLPVGGGVITCPTCGGEIRTSVVQAVFGNCPDDSDWEVSLLVVKVGKKQINLPFSKAQQVHCEALTSYSLEKNIPPGWKGKEAVIEFLNIQTGEVLFSEPFEIGGE